MVADPQPVSPDRDGTSQEERRLLALDPEYVLVDERGPRELLAFAKEFGSTLKYFDHSDQEAGDWSHFVDPRLDLDEVVAFMEHPERFSPDRSPLLYRPHFVLFLAFLKLVETARGELNTFGRRHLDFYYRQYLQMSTKPARPDRVNLQIDLAPGVEAATLTAGTVMTAGPDSTGRDLLYATDRDVFLSHAQVERLSSVHVERRVTDLAGARAANRNDHESAAISMLEIALGRPEPGDKLPAYRSPAMAAGREVTHDLLVELGKLLRFAADNLNLTFVELRKLMKLLEKRQANAERNWAEINRLLGQVGQERAGTVPPDPSSHDFDRNLIAAVGGAPEYQKVEVDTVYELFEERARREVQAFIKDDLHFEYEDFVEMMLVKNEIDSQWNGINDLLSLAGRRWREDKNFSLNFASPSGPDRYNFKTNFDVALPEVDFSSLDGIDSLSASLGGIDALSAYVAAVEAAESYFFTNAESVAYLLAAFSRRSSSDHQWSKVDSILSKAHREMRLAQGSERLAKIRVKDGFPAMIRHALGEDDQSNTPQDAGDASTLLDQLEPFLADEDDRRLLERLSNKSAQATDDEWAVAERIVAVARWSRLGRPEPVPRKEEWLNVYPAADATAVAAGAADGSGQEKQWSTFGRPETQAEKDPPEPVLGWAVSSPILSLGEGTRTIRLAMSFEQAGFERTKLAELLTGERLRDDLPIQFGITTEKGWVEPDIYKVQIGTYAEFTGNESAPADQTDDALLFSLEWPETVDAMVRASPEVVGIDSSWPVLRLMLAPRWRREFQRHVIEYPSFKTLMLSAVHLGVSVTGLRPSQLQNDDSSLDPNKPFEPFGSSPAVGSRLLIGHPELATKQLKSLSYQVEWMGAPRDIKDHYRQYDLGKQEFTARLGLVDRRADTNLLAAAALFPAADDAEEKDAEDNKDTNDGRSVELRVEHVPAALGRLVDARTSGDLSSWSRYLHWQLNAPDFQHQAYPSVAATKSIEMAAAVAKLTTGQTIVAKDYQVDPPYTPKIKSLKIDYSSEVEIRFDATAARTTTENPPDRVLHVHPFGSCDAEVARTAAGVPLLPRYENQGELYLGVRDVQPPQTLSVLFQMVEGSGDPDLEPAPVRWSFLSGDRWIPLEDRDLLADTTRGLRNSGIIELALKPTLRNQQLAGDLYWLRASVERNSNSLCDTVALHAQAVSAELVDNGNAPDHFDHPLPAQSIKTLVEPDPQISAVHQPYTSAGGRPAERESAFNTRVSERLRHKQRAVTMWDYERLVLERFPEIYKVKCLPANPQDPSEPPGSVQVIVIPDVRAKLPFDPFGPRAPADLLADIQQYLDERSPDAAVVEVRNPHYVAVKVRLAVRFRDESNQDYFKEQLAADLNRFLSPWAYDDGAEIAIAGKIYANSIVNFLDRRPYVDYLAYIRLFTSQNSEDFTLAKPDGPEKSYFVSAGRPDGVLVAATRHEIDLISDAGYRRELLTGINYMSVELDFQVAEDSKTPEANERSWSEGAQL